MGVSRTMFSKFKSGSTASVAPNVLESNPIWQLYDVGKQLGTAGPENVWKILEGFRKADGQEVSIFLFEKRSVEKIHKPKRKEAVAELLRIGIRQLERFRHPKVLKVVHPVEECQDTIAFVSEPLMASLANVLASEEQRHITESLSASTTGGSNSTLNHHHQQSSNQQTNRPVFVKDYEFLGIEVKYGLLQITEALYFLHASCQVMHRNICPSSILINKRGTWKLCGFEFVERVNEREGIEHTPLPQWTNRLSKITQPNLDYLAPEIQQKKYGCTLSDMYSLGMVMCAIFNNGRPLIHANHNVSDYQKQQETLENHIHQLLPRVPVPLQESVSRLLHKDINQRPTAQVITYIKYFNDPSVQAFQFLDVINMKDPNQKMHFYRTTLKEVLPYVPKKMWFMHVWPILYQEACSAEVLAAVLQPMFYMLQNCSQHEYDEILWPQFKKIFINPRSIHGSVAILENLHIILERSSQDLINKEILPVYYNAFESSTSQIQLGAYVALPNVKNYVDDSAMRRTVVPKMKLCFGSNVPEQKIILNAIPHMLDRVDKQQIADDVVPILMDAKLTDPDIMIRVINLYRLLMSDKKYGLTATLLATSVMPNLLPHAVNPTLNLDLFSALLELLQELLNFIERNQRNKLKLDNLSLPSPERHRPLRHQYSTDNMHVPPFNIPNLRIEQRKTSSAEDMARKNSIGSMSMTASAENMTGRKNSMAGMLGSWWFGSTSSANADSNFLRVANTFTSRRLSDNTLMTPKIRIAPSCASSPGGTPGGGLPIRRHSSTGPQERRGSNINLSPPTGGGMPITSSSVPYLLSSSMSSIRGSRRPSVSSTSSQQGSGLLQQFGSGMYQLFSGRS